MFSGAVQANLPIAESHSHMVLSILVPISMLSTRLAAIIMVLRATLTATSTMVTLLFINNGLNTLACLHLSHNISTHHMDNGK
jgi:hypothetical protein